MNEITFDIMKVVVAVCAALVTVYLVPYIKTLKEDKRYGQIIKLIEVAVRAAEQTIKGAGMGEAKKLAVMDYVSRYMDSIGIKVTTEQLDHLIECAVYQMKQEG